jgi:hypothetical protein
MLRNKLEERGLSQRINEVKHVDQAPLHIKYPLHLKYAFVRIA